MEIFSVWYYSFFHLVLPLSLCPFLYVFLCSISKSDTFFHFAHTLSILLFICLSLIVFYLWQNSFSILLILCSSLLSNLCLSVWFLNLMPLIFHFFYLFLSICSCVYLLFSVSFLYLRPFVSQFDLPLSVCHFDSLSLYDCFLWLKLFFFHLVLPLPVWFFV